MILTHLFAILLEEPRGIHTVRDGTPDDGKPMKDDGWLIRVLGYYLLENIEKHGDEEESRDNNSNLRHERELGQLLGQRPRDLL